MLKIKTSFHIEVYKFASFQSLSIGVVSLLQPHRCSEWISTPDEPQTSLVNTPQSHSMIMVSLLKYLYTK